MLGRNTGLPELPSNVLGVGDGDREGYRANATGVPLPVLYKVSD